MSVQTVFQNKKVCVVLPIVKFMAFGPNGHPAQPHVSLKAVKSLRKREIEIVW